jgi:hypothetical protein
MSWCTWENHGQKDQRVFVRSSDTVVHKNGHNFSSLYKLTYNLLLCFWGSLLHFV